MIPKIIHYCWISGDPFPEKIQKCVDSWKKYLPDYEVVVWDYEKVHALHSRWCEEAMACKKYAFVADYVRFYALYNYGGIYLDSDVEVIKPFNDLLQLRYFVGQEDSSSGWEAAIIGAEKGLPWIKMCLNYYRMRQFTNCFGEMDTTPLPRIMKTRLSKKYQIQDCVNVSDWFYATNIICRFPSDWFSPKNYETSIITLTDNTRSIHHFSGSWLNIKLVSANLSLFQRTLIAIRPLGSKVKHVLFPWKYKH